MPPLLEKCEPRRQLRFSCLEIIQRRARRIASEAATKPAAGERNSGGEITDCSRRVRSASSADRAGRSTSRVNRQHKHYTSHGRSITEICTETSLAKTIEGERVRPKEAGAHHVATGDESKGGREQEEVARAQPALTGRTALVDSVNGRSHRVDVSTSASSDTGTFPSASAMLPLRGFHLRPEVGRFA
jgi:hypothetical protein